MWIIPQWGEKQIPCKELLNCFIKIFRNKKSIFLWVMAHNTIKILLIHWHVYLSLHICTPAYWRSWFHHLYARRKLTFECSENTNTLQPVFQEPRRRGTRWLGCMLLRGVWEGRVLFVKCCLSLPTVGLPPLTAVFHVGWHLRAELRWALRLQPRGWLPPHHGPLPLPRGMVRWEPRAAPGEGEHANVP